MDNLTHTVIGCITGEALHRSLPGRAAPLGERRRPLFLAAGMLGNNLPDLDLLWSYRGRDRQQLTYLLDHRGYTHTLAGCVLLAVLLAAALGIWARHSGLLLTHAERARLLLVALLGTGLHLAMDALNSYGVHPFWPLDDRWYYGDAVYIVEPWYWSAAAPLILLVRSRPARVLLILLQVLALGLVLFSGRVPMPCALALGAVSATLLLACRPAPARRAAAAGAAAFAVVTGVFVLGSHLAHAELDRLAAAGLPRALLIDTVFTPLPADPLCWDALRLSVEGEFYVARRAVIALAPALIPARACRDTAFTAAGTLPWSAPTDSDATALRCREFSMPLGALREVARRDCRAAAFLQFARAPFVSRTGGDFVLGDLRFAGARDAGFATLRIGPDAPSSPCSPRAPWVAPRAALLLPGF